MIAINHALTGALVGLAIHAPIAAIPLAVLSHFALDAIPHFTDDKLKIESRKFTLYLFIDAALCGLLVLVLAFLSPPYWQLAAFCAFLAASPDFMWAPAFIRTLKGHKFILPRHPVAILHAKIQWFARPIGIIVEVAWFAGTYVIMLELLLQSVKI